MKLGVVLHEGDTLAFDGMGDYRSGLAFGGSGLFERRAHSSRIVAIDFNDVPTEAAPR